MTIAEIEDAIIAAITRLGIFATLQSAGRQDIPEVYAYPAAFVFFDGDKDTGNVSRPIDDVLFTVTIQIQNMSQELAAARDAYTINDQVRGVIRFKTLDLADIAPFACVSRACTGYDDSEGVIEYTHSYQTRLYQPVVM
jgi:hypothetical protein